MSHTASLIRLIDTARLHLPGALEGVLRMELFNVTKKFLQRTNAWQDTVTIDVIPAVYDYPLPASQNGAFINRLIWLEGPRSNVNDPDSGPPRDGFMTTPGFGQETLRIPNPPGANEVWYAHVAMCIADPTDADGVAYAPEWIYDKYQDVLLDGLLERMMAQPAKPYSNTQGVLLHGRRFQSGMSTARAEAAHRFTFGGNSWRYPRPYRASSQRY